MGQKCTTYKVTVENLGTPSIDNALSHVSRTRSGEGSVYCAAKPLYLISKLVGLASFSWTREEPGKGSKAAYRLFIILCCTFHVFGVGIIYKKKMFDNPSNKPAKLNFSNVLFVTACFATAFASLITGSTVFQKHLPRVLFKVSCVDRILFRYGKGRECYNRNRLLVAHLLLGVLVTTSIYVWDYFLFCHNKGYQCPLKLGLRLFASLTSIVMVFQLIFSSLLLRQKFRTMNLLLNSWFSKREQGRENKDVEMVRQMRRVYLLLRDSSCLVSSHFGVPILLACTWLFLGALTNLSFAMEMARGWSQDRHNFLQIIFFDVTISGGSLLLLEEISVICHLTSTEANHTGVVIQRILVKYASVLHSAVEREFESFSCQVERMKVHFSAAGFFLLDVPFFYGVIGVTCTYLTVMAELESKQ